jgi:hypothetical protein
MDVDPAVMTMCADCDLRDDPLTFCGDRGCAYRWQREGYEDRQQRDEMDRQVGLTPRSLHRQSGK